MCPGFPYTSLCAGTPRFNRSLQLARAPKGHEMSEAALIGGEMSAGARGDAALRVLGELAGAGFFQVDEKRNVVADCLPLANVEFDVEMARNRGQVDRRIG